MTMEDLTALPPQHGVVNSPEVFQQSGAITRMWHDTMKQLGVMPRLQSAARTCSLAVRWWPTRSKR